MTSSHNSAAISPSMESNPSIICVHIVMACCPGMGHIRPMLAFAKDMVKHREDVLVTVFGILTKDQADKMSAQEIDRVRFHAIIDDSERFPFTPYSKEEKDKLINDMVTSLDGTPSPSCVVFDMFATWAVLLAEVYQIPNYLFMACSLRSCAVMATVDPSQPMTPNTILSLTEEETINTSDLEPFRVHPEAHELMKGHIKHWLQASGILVNDIEEFSSQALIHKLKSMAIPASRKLGVYNIGPVGLDILAPEVKVSDPVVAWLDTQQTGSVVYVALGSWCELPVADVCELAFALKDLNTPVLWAYRGRSDNSFKQPWLKDRPCDIPIEKDGLPCGFREGLSPTQFMIAPWVNQIQVLRHPAVRLFLSHCGWNSTLEALSLMGKPMAMLPIGAEQGLNAHELSEKMKLGKRLWSCDLNNRQLVRADVVRDLQECLSCEDFKSNALKIQQTIEAAVSPTHGSSPRNLRSFFDDVQFKL
eukprot:Blabericola_migrator_1__6272@NODE_3165_length_1987_cov_908_466667_g338_i2_p1_GENE_NODE_3165_length_1987_cov_908_466667_g338_i2NODE_3165_length_1987_cov_908_466667_g338_i2_p1_ORF_typecomplete_len476_score85_68UDPGT/PF00201_18/7_9e36Glyco_tran_28_C/PF04101_16/1_9e05_NODE_3165_length_1987_cov_908_466667_g338_i22581685